MINLAIKSDVENSITNKLIIIAIKSIIKSDYKFNSIFLYCEAVKHSSKTSPVYDYLKLAFENGTEIHLCSTACVDYGIIDDNDSIENKKNFEFYQISGLGFLNTLILENQKVLYF